MSLLFKRTGNLSGLESLIPSRLPSNAVTPTRDASRTSSVKWACLRLRADLVSTTPLDVYRQSTSGPMVSVRIPPVLDSPDGLIDITEWLYSSQTDLDDIGNAFGFISAVDGAGFPARIELLPADKVVVRVQSGEVSYWVDGERVPTERIWHERQFTVSGSPVGLSPTAYAALAMSANLSAQQFAASWFAGHGVPAAHLRNSAKTLNASETAAVKEKFTTTVATGDVFVTGSDWEYSPIGAKASEAAFLETIAATGPDICRFHGVPGDMVDVESSTGSITYANVTQRNLQLLILNLGPAFARRERAFSRRLTPRGQVVKFNTDAILRMDSAARITQMGAEIENRLMTVTEGRTLLNRPPLTPDDEAEFARLFPSRSQTAGVTNA